MNYWYDFSAMNDAKLKALREEVARDRLVVEAQKRQSFSRQYFTQVLTFVLTMFGLVGR
jgi:hypothetical protein